MPIRNEDDNGNVTYYNSDKPKKINMNYFRFMTIFDETYGQLQSVRDVVWDLKSQVEDLKLELFKCKYKDWTSVLKEYGYTQWKKVCYAKPIIIQYMMDYYKDKYNGMTLNIYLTSNRDDDIHIVIAGSCNPNNTFTISLYFDNVDCLYCIQDRIIKELDAKYVQKE